MASKAATKEVDHASRGHAVLSPSSAHRWRACPGSLWLSKGLPQPPTSDAAAEGTLAHEWIEKATAFVGKRDSKKFEALIESIRNQNSKWDDDAMAEHVEDYVKYIESLEGQFQALGFKILKRLVETPIRFSKNIYGTVDYGLLGVRKAPTKNQYAVVISDFKYGRGVDVDAEDNDQVLIYGIGAGKELTSEYEVKPDALFIFIQQPRTGKKAKSWILKGQELIEQKELEVAADEKRALKVYNEGATDADFHIGDHCRFCPALSRCKHFKEQTKAIALLDVEDFPVEMDVKSFVASLSDEQKFKIYAHKKSFEQFLEAVAFDLEHRLELGILTSPDYKVVESQTKRTWAGDPEDIGPKLTALGIENPYRPSLITLGEAEKQLKKFKDKTLLEGMDALTKRPPARKQIAPIDDPRPAVDVKSLTADMEDFIEVS